MNDENLTVIPLLKSFDSLTLSDEASIKIENKRKEKTKAKNIPATIIFPKSITGLISLTPSEAKAMIVVRAV